MDYADWIADVEEYFREDIEAAEPPADDEFTVDEFWRYLRDKKGSDIGRRWASELLVRAVNQGDMEVRQYKPPGRNVRVNLYRFVK